MKYIYAYKTSDGTRHEESIEGESREAVFAALREKGIRAIKVVAADGSKANGEVKKGYSWASFLGAFPNWTQALTSIAALVVSLVALYQTRTANDIQDQMRLNSERVEFRVEHSLPQGVTNDYWNSWLVRDVKVFNDGFRMKSLNSLSLFTVLHISVFDKNKASSGSHDSQSLRWIDYYKDERWSFQPKGVLYEAKGREEQLVLANAIRNYERRHPDRFCRIIPLDYVNIQYVDMRGETHEEWLIDGCISDKESFEGAKRKSKELCKLFDKTHPLKYWEQLFDKCFELSEKK